MEGQTKRPDIHVGARDIDAMISHFSVNSNMDTVSLRKLVEGQMNRIEIELTSKLVETSELFKKFKPLADTQLTVKCTLDTLEELISTLQPLLLQVMDKRSFGHFLHFIGGLRSIYICLLEMFSALRRVITFQMSAAKPNERKKLKSLSNVISGASNWMKGVEDPGKGGSKVKGNLFSSQASYTELRLEDESPIRISQSNGELFSAQMKSTIDVLQHLIERLNIILGLWIPADSEGDLASASRKLVFTPFKLISELYKSHPELDPSKVYGCYHFGFTYALSLVEYTKKLKSVFCAVKDSTSWKDSKLMSNTLFYSSAARYFITPDLASSYYEKIRTEMSVDVLSQVWNLMEDPVIEFFATALGLNPKKIELPVDTPILWESKIIPLTIEYIDQLRKEKEQGQEHVPRSQEFSKYYENNLLIKGHYLFSREVVVDSSLFPKNSEDIIGGPFSIPSFRSLFDLSNIRNSNRDAADPSAQKDSVTLKEMSKKLSGFTKTRKGYRNVLPTEEESEAESSMYNEKKDKFNRRRDNFLDSKDISSPKQDRGYNSDSSSTSGSFSDVELDENLKEKKSSPKIGNLIDLGEEFTVVIEDPPMNIESLKDQQDDVYSVSIKEYTPVIILHIHGGGWISQSPKTHLVYLREWAKRTNLPVLSVDYSLSPTSEFPGALNECVATYKWLLNIDNAQAIGLPALDSPPRVILVGDSAGGNLCCGLMARIIEEELPKPIGMLLSYPVIDISPSASISRMAFGNDPVLNYQSMMIVLGSYLGSRTDLALTEPLVSPKLLSDDILRQFPPTSIMVGDIDPLIDDSTYFFYRLREVGVSTTLNIYRRLPHGYLNLPAQLPNANVAIADGARLLKKMMHDNDKIRGFTVF